MIALAILLSLPMGLVLGMLGGGGSILTLPILVYALGLGTKEAIATSLLVVGVTSAICTLQHARAGNVDYKTGLVFGAFAMIGAYIGGMLAAYVPGDVLLLVFTLLMIFAAVAMLRPRKTAAAGGSFAPTKVVIEGLVVGGVTGMVGAGGGFVVVPALVLFGGLDMRIAIGTSLLIIMLKSFAGLAGHLGHVSIDVALAAAVIIPAVLGSFIGARLSYRLEPARLRKSFAYFVLLMAAFMLYKSAPAWLFSAVVAAHWPLWVGGLAILGLGLSSLLVLRQRSQTAH